MIERPELGIAADGNERGHVESGSNGCATAADRAGFVQPTTVVIEGSYTDEAGDLSTVQATEFRQFGQEGVACGWTDSLGGLQNLILAAPCVAGLNGPGELLVDFRQLPIEQFDNRVDGVLDFGEAGLMTAVGLRGAQLQQLPVSRDQGLEFSCVFIGKFAYGRLDVVSEASQNFRVDAIGLRENAQRTGVIADLTRVDEHNRQRGLVESQNQWNFVTAGSLDDDPGNRPFAKLFDEACDAIGTVGEAFGDGGREVGQIESLGGDVDAEETLDVCVGKLRIVHGGRPFLANAGFDGPGDCSG